jgi:hypothetical protein
MRPSRSVGVYAATAALIVIVVLAAVGYVSWNRDSRHAGPANPGFSCPPIVPVQHGVPPATGDVRRVALIGDSIMDQASCAIAESLAKVGIASSRHGVGGSGLLVGIDWVEEARKLLRAEHPDAVIAIFVGNFLVFGAQPDSSISRIKEGSPEFFRAWQRRAEQLSAVVHAAGAEMYWVSPPPISVPPLSHAARVYAGYQTIPGDHFLDSGEVLAGPDDREVIAKKTCGRPRTIRTPERIHLTPDGARIYGQQIAHDFTAQLGIVTAPKPC